MESRNSVDKDVIEVRKIMASYHNLVSSIHKHCIDEKFAKELETKVSIMYGTKIVEYLRK